MRAFLVTVAMTSLLVGCDSKQTALPSAATMQKVQSDYDAALSDATNSIPFAADFARFVPVTQCFFSYYLGGAGPSQFCLKGCLYDRYQFSMVVPVTFDNKRRKIETFGEPEFLLQEVSRVERDPDGRLSISWSMDGQRRFGAGDWQRIVNAGGDFSAIGYTCVTNNPAPGFDDLRKDEEMRMRKQP
jgi:hypothetical protein